VAKVDKDKKRGLDGDVVEGDTKRVHLETAEAEMGR
jgi:hypothetical protein